MSDDTNSTASAPAPHVEEAARGMGWRPLEEFRGDPSKWVDADTFVSRGEHYLPILKADRDRAKREADELRSELAKTRELVAASAEAIEELKTYQSEATKRSVEAARQQWIKQLKDAREVGDVDAEVRAQSEIVKIDTALAAPAPPAPAPAAKPSSAPAVDPDFVAWEAENPWFKTDARKHGLAMGIAKELRDDPKNATLVGRAFYDRITQEMEAYLNPQRPAPSKVAGSRPASAGGSERTRTYADLPADAKAACDGFAAKLVGPGRAYKDLAAWQAHYVNQYFSE